jgi:hypothetical protein
MMVTVTRDLRARFAAARDQGNRPTCLAFAMSDVHSFSRGMPFALLSAEYLFYHGVQRSTPPNPNRGVHVAVMGEALEHDGQPVEPDWPYLPALPHPISTWTPPAGITVFRHALTVMHPSVATIIASLDNDVPVVISLTISVAFYTPDSDAVVSDETPGPPTGCHAIAAVGYGSLGGKTMILVRNSWGMGWGDNGHAWLSEDYLTPRLLTVSAVN